MEENELLRRLGLSEFISLDLETTGLDPQRDEIIEFGAVLFRDGRSAERLGSLVRPEGPVPQRVLEFTGIAQWEIEAAPALSEALPRLLEFLGGRGEEGERPVPVPVPVLVAHNADFDRAFLEAGAHRVGLSLPLPPHSWLDTLLLARILLPELYNHKLETVARGLGLAPKEESHRALEDAEQVGLILIGLLRSALEVPSSALESLVLLSPPGPGLGLRRLFEGLLSCRRERKTGRPHPASAQARTEACRPPPRLEPDEGFRLDPDQIEAFFREGGPLSPNLPSFNERPEQIAMAREVAGAFNASHFLIAEAGTGTGKSFAYLIPAILWARSRGERVIVSTNTKNLQDQLFKKDIPFLREVLGDFQAVLLKGRRNYLCRHKWESLLLERAGRLDLELEPEKETEYLTIPVWLEGTSTGDLTENGGFWKGKRSREIAAELTDDPDYCLGRRCPFQEDCFSLRARRAALKAEIVVVNHALLLADLDYELLGEYRYLIVDEAHNLEEAASEALTRRLSFWELIDFCDELYQVRGPRPPAGLGLLPLLRERIGKGRLDPKLKTKLLERLEEGLALVEDLRRRSRGFFSLLTEVLRERKGLKEEDYPLDYPEKGQYDHRLFEFEGLQEELGEVKLGLALVGELLRGLQTALEGLREDSLIDRQGLLGRTGADLARAERLIEALEFMAAAEAEEGYVFWFELPVILEHFAILYATPVEVGELLHQGLFSRLEVAILTSATLTVGGDFRYLEERLGLDHLPRERVHARSFGDPFDYKRISRLAVPEFLPLPDDLEFHLKLAELLRDLSRRLGRRMMVLFTSYKALQQVHRQLREGGEGELFVQGLEGSRAQLMEGFKHSSKRAILLGTSSFWEGVDLPGEDLEILVLAKLPFPVPGDPVVAARAKRLEASGRDPFNEFHLPQAVLRLRQGFGRLIRTEQDRGVVIIADNRIIRQRYGRTFQESLPLPLTTYYTPSRLLVELEEFFEGGG